MHPKELPVYKIPSCHTHGVVVRKTQVSDLDVLVLSSFVSVRIRGADVQIEPVIFLEKSPNINFFFCYCLK